MMDENDIFEELNEEEAAQLEAEKSPAKEELPDDPAVDKKAEEPAPDKNKTETKQEPAEKKQPKMVPHAAMHEERMARKQAEQELARMREERARFEERLRLIQEAQQEEPPDPDSQPIEAIKYANRQNEELRRQMREQAELSQREQQARAYHEQVMNYANQTVAQFKEETPDYLEAVTFLENARLRGLQAIGRTESQARQIIQSEAIQLAADCAQRGANLGEALYALAESYGYQKKPDTQAAEEQIKKIAEGQTRNKTLSQAGGKSETTEMTVERLLAMDDSEFEAWKKKYPKRHRALMGG